MTTVYPQPWERTLFPLAYEAEHQGVAPTSMLVSDPALLDRAYSYCDAITAAHSHTFYVASGLLLAWCSTPNWRRGYGCR